MVSRHTIGSRKAISNVDKSNYEIESYYMHRTELRKAVAVRKTVHSDISPDIPASILRRHKATWLYLDKGGRIVIMM
jgi:glucosamine-6-phosphate deaminase